MTTLATWMQRRTTQSASRVYCVVPRDLAAELHDELRRFYLESPQMEVLVERRTGDRRGGRCDPAAAPRPRRSVPAAERRLDGDRRRAPRRLATAGLPAAAAVYRRRIVFARASVPLSESEADARLVRLAQAGDSLAFGELYGRYHARVQRYLSGLLGDEQEAEDAAHEVFLSALDALPRYVESGAFRAWLFTIAQRRGLTQLSREHALATDPEQILTHVDATESCRLEAASLFYDEEIWRIVRRLSKEQQRVFVLRHALDWTHGMIAVQLDKTPEAVRKLEGRASAILAERLTELGQAPERRHRMPMLTRMKPLPVMARRRFALAIARPGHAR